MTSLYLAVMLIAPGADRPPPPLAEEQLTKVRALVRTHMEEQTKLKDQLDKAQKKLAICYSQYELKDDEVNELHEEIFEVQKKLLHSYHTMQKELRSIVGPERFQFLSQRINNALRSTPSEPRK